jgi:diacylglycerol kinase (ATP)
MVKLGSNGPLTIYFMRNTPTIFSWRARRRSFLYAGAGIYYLLKTEHNARIHLAITVLVAGASVYYLAITVLVAGASVYFKISRLEMALLFFAIGLVWVTEILNTCIEKTLDFITQKRCEEIKRIKDIAAGAVLIAAFTAILIGAIVFIPKIIVANGY